MFCYTCILCIACSVLCNILHSITAVLILIMTFCQYTNVMKKQKIFFLGLYSQTKLQCFVRQYVLQRNTSLYICSGWLLFIIMASVGTPWAWPDPTSGISAPHWDQSIVCRGRVDSGIRTEAAKESPSHCGKEIDGLNDEPMGIWIGGRKESLVCHKVKTIPAGSWR